MKFFPASVLLAFGLTLASAAQAAITTFNYTATIVYANVPTLPSVYPLGGTIHGQLRLDDSIANTNNVPGSATYVNALHSSLSTVGDTNVSTQGGNVVVEHIVGVRDSIRFFSGPFFGTAGTIVGPTVEGWRFIDWELGLDDYTATALQSSVFPTTSILSNLNAFDSHLLYFAYYKEGLPLSYVVSDISNITAVPELDSYAMLLAGLGILGLAARRQRKQK